MDRFISVLLSVFLVGVLVIYSGCGGGAASDNLGNIPVTPAPSPTPSPSPGPSPNPTLGTATSFFVGVDNTIADTAHVHLSSSFSSTCSIESSVSASQDLVCYIEIPEADLYLRDLPLKYYMPPNMCRYLTFETYWYYNEEIGKGPSTVNIHTHKTVTADASGTTLATNFDSVFDCTVDGVPDTGCATQTEISASVSTGDGSVAPIKCVYDRSDQEHKHNCCIGEYTYTQTITSDLVQPSGTTTTVTTSSAATKQWGGNVKDCIGGPGRNDWAAYDDDGYPIITFREAEAGMDLDYDIANPNKVLSYSTSHKTFHTANYYGDAATHTHSGYVVATSSDKPYFIEPIDDRSGSLIQSGHDSYEFRCMDDAFETKHRIRVYIREWDTKADFDHYVVSGGTYVNPDRGSQSAPAGCADFSGEACNDFHDLDDFLTIDLASYGGVYAPSSANRDRNFPYLRYK